MSYFSKFPLYAYDVQDTQNRTLITDILRRVNLKGNALANTLVFDQYVVQDGDQSHEPRREEAARADPEGLRGRADASRDLRQAHRSDGVRSQNWLVRPRR